MSRFTDEQNEKLKDLLAEKSLWQVYLSSRKIPFSQWNIGIGVVVAVLLFYSCLFAKSPAAIADQLLAFATLSFPLAIGQLGFLLAGFSFFATVADKGLFCRMADKTHQKSGLSFIKYNFLVFMRVFVEYLIFTFACLGILLLLTKGLGAREAISQFLGQWPKTKLPVAAGAFGLFSGCLVYLLMQLASFIYNIYHVVMTSIRWELQKHYDDLNKNEILTEQETDSASLESNSDS